MNMKKQKHGRLERPSVQKFMPAGPLRAALRSERVNEVLIMIIHKNSEINIHWLLQGAQRPYGWDTKPQPDGPWRCSTDWATEIAYSSPPLKKRSMMKFNAWLIESLLNSLNVHGLSFGLWRYCPRRYGDVGSPTIGYLRATETINAKYLPTQSFSTVRLRPARAQKTDKFFP